MKIENVKISDLKPAPYNPRKLSEKQKSEIYDSLTEFGFVDPVIVNRYKGRENFIIGGHQRVKVWGEMGNDEVPVFYVSLPEEKERRLNLRLNKNTGSWDYEILLEEFETEELIEIGFEEDELTPTEEIEEVPQETEGDDDIPESAPPITVYGDIYELNGHRLMCGDSTSIDEISKLFSGKIPDMVFTDPPYGISIVDSKTNNIGPKNLAKSKEYDQIIGDDTTETAKEFYYSCISLGFKKFCIWGGNYFSDFLPPSSCWIVWDKRGEMNSNNFADGELAWTNIDYPVRIYKQIWNGMIREGESGSRIHPTQKPVDLSIFCFNELKSSGIIFDGFLGSGSTLIACEKSKRICYGIEMSDKYCDLIVKRYVNFCKENNRPCKILRNGKKCTDFDEN